MNRRLWALPALALLAAGVIWWQRPTDAPAATWRVGSGTDFRHGRDFDELPPESPVRLSVHAAAPTHIYVFSQSREDGTLLLWPSPGLRGDIGQPLPAGQSVLPGSLDGKELAWTTRGGVRAGTTFVVIAALAPVPELESLLPQLRHWSNTVFPDGAMVVTRPAAPGSQGTPPRTEWPSALLQRAAADVPEGQPNGPLRPDPILPGVFTSRWRVVEKAG
ncbi:MAG: hypothetical protein KF830_09445 [Planctomycetes bacterium]|nr:hypothetical protein [Planctomycetota bacterium]